MRRYRLEASPTDLSQISLEGDLYHHIVDVCRLGEGSKFELLDLDGNAHLVEIIQLDRRRALARQLETRRLPEPPKPHLILALAVPRFPVLESVLEKCVELGIFEVRLFFSKYSFVRGNEKISESKWERWRKIVQSSTQQSGRADLMQIHAPVPLDELLKTFNPEAHDWGLIAYEGEVPRSIHEALRPPPATLIGAERLWCFVGAEGGFAREEVQALEKRGVQAVTLGEQVLRVETACITLASILKYEVGHFGGKNDETSRRGSV